MGNQPSSSSSKSRRSRHSSSGAESAAERAKTVIGDLHATFQSSVKRLEEQDHPAAHLIDSVCGQYFENDEKMHGRHSRSASFYSEDISEDDSRTISEDDATLDTDYRNGKSKKDAQSVDTSSYQSDYASEMSREVTRESKKKKRSSRKSGDDDEVSYESEESYHKGVVTETNLNVGPGQLSKPLASSFAKRCYFTKSGIGKTTQHYEGLTLTGNVVLMLAAAMKLKGCPTICDEDLRRVEQTYPNQFSRLPDELLLSSGWRRISKYCHFSNKPIPDGIPFFHSKQRLHPTGGYFFLLAAAVGMVRPIDVEPLTKDTLVLLETDYPAQCDAAPPALISEPGEWTLVDKFCFFSGGPINTDEDVYYQADFDGNLIYMLAFLSPSLSPEELYKLDITDTQAETGLKSVAAVEEVESVYDLTERDFHDLKLYHLGPCRALPQYILQPQAWTKVLPPHFLAARQRAILRAQEYEAQYGVVSMPHPPTSENPIDPSHHLTVGATPLDARNHEQDPNYYMPHNDQQHQDHVYEQQHQDQMYNRQGQEQNFDQQHHDQVYEPSHHGQVYEQVPHHEQRFDQSSHQEQIIYDQQPHQEQIYDQQPQHPSMYAQPSQLQQQPMYDQPMQQPMYEQTHKQPVYDQSQQPVYEQHHQNQVFEQPHQQTMFEHQNHQPMYEQPHQQPVYEQSNQQPVYENYNASEVSYQTQSTDPYLPVQGAAPNPYRLPTGDHHMKPQHFQQIHPPPPPQPQPQQQALQSQQQQVTQQQLHQQSEPQLQQEDGNAERHSDFRREVEEEGAFIDSNAPIDEAIAAQLTRTTLSEKQHEPAHGQAMELEDENAAEVVDDVEAQRSENKEAAMDSQLNDKYNTSLKKSKEESNVPEEQYYDSPENKDAQHEFFSTPSVEHADENVLSPISPTESKEIGDRYDTECFEQDNYDGNDYEENQYDMNNTSDDRYERSNECEGEEFEQNNYEDNDFQNNDFRNNDEFENNDYEGNTFGNEEYEKNDCENNDYEDNQYEENNYEDNDYQDENYGDDNYEEENRYEENEFKEREYREGYAEKNYEVQDCIGQDYYDSPEKTVSDTDSAEYSREMEGDTVSPIRTDHLRRLERRNHPSPPQLESPRSEFSHTSAMRGAQELLRKNRLRRLERARRQSEIDVGPEDEYDPAQPQPTNSMRTDDESAATWEESGSEITSVVSGSSVWTDNSNPTDRSSRRALILQMAKARMKSNKEREDKVNSTILEETSDSGEADSARIATDIDFSADLD